MNKKKTTIQDIADSLGFSRVTVSKALNRTLVYGVPKEQKEIILNRAKLMNYKAFRSDTMHP